MYKFDPKGEPPETAFRAIALAQIDEALAELDKTDGEGRSVVHEARRRCKKLRGLLRLVRPGFAEFAVENAALRDAAALLSHLRDAEVLDHTIAGLKKTAASQALDTVEWTLKQQAPEVSQAERLDRFRKVLSEIRGRAEHWSLDRTGVRAVLPGLRANYRTVRRRMRRAQSSKRASDLHEWRKANKSFGFHVDLLKRSAPDVLDTELEAIDRLSTMLGEHHDLTVLDQAVGDREEQLSSEIAAAVHRDIAGRRDSLAHDAFELGRQVLAERPRALARRFKTYWNSVS